MYDQRYDVNIYIDIWRLQITTIEPPAAARVPVRMESARLWVGAGSRPAGLRTGRAIPGLRRDAALPARQNTRQGREGGALPKPLLLVIEECRLGCARAGRGRQGAKPNMAAVDVGHAQSLWRGDRI